MPEVFTEPVPDPLRDLVLRYARTHGPFGSLAVAERYGLGVAVVTGTLHRLAAEGILTEGDFEPSGGSQWCEVGVLRMLRRRCLAKLRKEVEPAPPSVYAAFLPAWQHADAAATRLRRGRPQQAGAGPTRSTTSSISWPGRRSRRRRWRLWSCPAECRAIRRPCSTS